MTRAVDGDDGFEPVAMVVLGDGPAGVSLWRAGPEPDDPPPHAWSYTTLTTGR